jgi:plasmid stabilization system protein ParE
MAGKKRKSRNVIYSRETRGQLDEIWEWNNTQYGGDHVDQYVAFLEDQIDSLGKSFELGRRIGSKPSRRYMLVRRRPGGHGHVVVYEFDDNHVTVLNVFHSAQNWRAKLSGG